VPLVTDLKKIKSIAAKKEVENDRFKIFLKQQDAVAIDTIVHQLNETITPQIDCTQCGNCCRSLMINVTVVEADSLAAKLKMSLQDVKEKYIEESEQGQLIMNTIPCHFLTGTSCSIYENRFNECKEFPHLHKPNFTGRLFGTLMYYEMCPIIFNVVEQLKEAVSFTNVNADFD
jgi:Fe-S-cluster containining protein